MCMMNLINDPLDHDTECSECPAQLKKECCEKAFKRFGGDQFA